MDEMAQDPVAVLAAAAGYDDPERWWDDLIESRLDGQSPFAALTEAMAQVRAASPARPGEQAHEQRREAYMRQVLRAALRDTARAGQRGPVAVICGAWHAPALAGKLPPATADAACCAACGSGKRRWPGCRGRIPAGRRVRLRRRDHLAGLVPPPVHHVASTPSSAG